MSSNVNKPGADDVPDYTIAVINFNGMKVLQPTLDALLRIPDEGMRIMVLDNGSTDGSREWVAREYPQLDLRLTADDGDVQRVRSYALENAETRYVMLLDNDLVLEPDCPARLLRAMRSRPDVLATTPRMVYIEKPDIIHNDVGRVHFLAISGRSDRGKTVGEIPPSDHPQPTVPGGIAMVDRELAARVGTFDDHYEFAWADDAHFYIRGAIAGLSSLHVSSALSYHPVPAHGYARAEGQIRNRYRFVLTMYAGRTLLLLAPPLLLFEVALTGVFLLKGLTGAQARALRDIWRGRKELRRTRRSIQATRRCPDTVYLDASGLSGGGPLSSRYVRGAGAVVNAALRGYWAVVSRLL
jgi:GT2 family glycosyltransferase